MAKFLILAFTLVALTLLARLASAATYTEALASATASGACYVAPSGAGWTVIQDCDADDAPDQSRPEDHLSASFADSPCALAGERALASEAEGEEFDFESTYEWAFDACERE